MSSITEILSQYLGDDTVEKISTEIGADRQTTENALSAALPMILGAVAKTAADPQGAEALHGAIQRDHDGGLLDNLGQLSNLAATQGAGILGHLFGGRKNQIENGLSKSTGLDTASATKLMAMLAPLVMGAVGKQQRQKNLSAGDLSNYLGQERQRLEQEAPEQMSLVGRMLDTDGDGDFDMSDLMRQGSKLLGGFFKRS